MCKLYPDHQSTMRPLDNNASGNHYLIFKTSDEYAYGTVWPLNIHTQTIRCQIYARFWMRKCNVMMPWRVYGEVQVTSEVQVTLIPQILFLMIKINNFWGDLSSISAKTATLAMACVWRSACNVDPTSKQRSNTHQRMCNFESRGANKWVHTRALEAVDRLLVVQPSFWGNFRVFFFV